MKLGILGGGQLGRMSAQAARKLDINVVIYTPETHSPAAQVASKTIVAAYDDQKALKQFAQNVDVISYEFENIPVKTVNYLNTLKPVYPEVNLLYIAQDRINEKSYLNQAGIPTARWQAVSNKQDIETLLKNWNTQDIILKTTRFGYDGKGQARIKPGTDIQAVLNQLNTDAIIAEEVIDFKCEISVIIARDAGGNIECYGPMLNEHKNHILHKTTMPAPLSEKLASEALESTHKLAESLNLRGVLALEMFVTKDDRLLANEIAPRTHNSGHWSIDACDVSQFENHVRAVCGMNVSPQNRHSNAEMINLIGEEVNQTAQYETKNGAHIHTYGKNDIKPGRKMGHLTILSPYTTR